MSLGNRREKRSRLTKTQGFYMGFYFLSKVIFNTLHFFSSKEPAAHHVPLISN